MATFPLATWKDCRGRALCAASVLAFALAAATRAQDTPAPFPPSPTPSPSPAASAARIPIRFVPPPLEGSISLGIFDANGQLVRVLHREAGLDEFEAGADGLVTEWDGENDRGEKVAPGKYSARGYVVGAGVKAEGVGYFFNDWVQDDAAPHIVSVENLTVTSENTLALLVRLAGDRDASLTVSFEGDLLGPVHDGREDERFLPHRAAVQVEGGKVMRHRAEGWLPVAWTELIAPLDAAPGRADTTWVIDRAANDSSTLVLKQFSAEGEVLREMNFPPEAPQPKMVAASTSSDHIFLLEENAAVQRVRGLSLMSANASSAASADKPVSEWNVVFEKAIMRHENFGLAQGQPVLAPETPAPATVGIQLTGNPLQREKSDRVEVAIGFDEEGSFLKTADGLPLHAVSETPFLVRAFIAAGGAHTVEVFQDDKAVVEHLRVQALDQMMSFDGGEIELK